MTPSVVSLRALGRPWNSFWHAPCDPRVCAIIRIAWGASVFLSFIGAYASVELWWSEQGFLPLAASQKFIGRYSWSLFHYLPTDLETLWLCFAVVLVQAACVVAGFLTRFNILCVFIWLVSFQHRNGLINDGEDTVFRMIGFFLLLMPSADVWSADAKLFPRPAAVRSGWGLRLLQIEVCLIVFSAGLEKLNGDPWWDGTALYYVMQLDDYFGHLPVPQFVRETLWLQKLMTWAALATEVVAPILIWFKETRRPALIALVGLHLSLLYMMNLFMFQYLMITAWLSFLDWEADLGWLRDRAARVRSRMFPASYQRTQKA